MSSNVSNAFCKSARIIPVWNPLSIPLKIKLVSGTRQESVETFARKPDWYLRSKPFSSKYSNLNDELMDGRALKKINTKLNFLWRQNNCLNYLSRRLLCNALIQSHFDYGCTSWYPLLSKAFKTNLQIAQNKYIRFCLELPPRGHISSSHFRKINYVLPLLFLNTAKE